MAQSLANVLIHLVFSTHHRRPLLRETERAPLHAYLGGVLGNHDCQPIELNSVRDHAHLLFALGKTIALAKAVEQVKCASSLWLKEQADWYGDFSWQRGYWAAGVSPRHAGAVRGYIRRQQEHHATVDFRDELRRLSRVNDLPLDERYVWD